MLTFICYNKCSTCQKAQAMLDSFDTKYEIRDIKTNNPTYDELKAWSETNDIPAVKFFNTRGILYKSLDLKNKLSSMSDDECLKLLATDGLLVKRPLLVDNDKVLVGFNHNEWESVLTDMASIPDEITIGITDSNTINFPFEWCINLGFVNDYLQVTLVDDRIAIHKPTADNVVYKAPCKVGDNSYIRSLGLFSVRVPKQLLLLLEIKDGDKADLTLEENCISIRKHNGNEPTIPDIETREPLMAFCCVCSNLLYTENALVKVASKYICHECVEHVKSM